MDIQEKNQLLGQFKKTKTFKSFYSTLMQFDESLNCFVATEKWRNKEAELLTSAWWMFEEMQVAKAAPKWISVEINSPNPHDQVLAFTNQNGTNIFETLFLDEFKDWKTTHWMPLPTSPLEQNK